MKTKYFFIAAIAGLALVGCNRELDPKDESKQGESSYMGFTISMPAATKADGTGTTGTYVEGADYENAIKTLHFFFYKDGAYVSWGYGDMASHFNSKPETGNVEETLHGTTPVKGVVVLESTMTMPTHVLCIANSTNPGWYRNKSLAQVLAALHSGSDEALNKHVKENEEPFKDFYFEDSGKPYFVMLTSPMYGSDAKGNKEVKYVTDVFVEKDADGNFTDDSYIKSTKAAAEDKPLPIYIERMAARLEIVNLSDDPAVNGILDASGYIKAANFSSEMKDALTSTPLWDIQPLAWSVTAANKKAYTIKHIDKNWFSKTGANEPFNGNWLESGTPKAINPLVKPYGSEEMFTRINWAMDPNYDSPAFNNRNSYPHSARELSRTSQYELNCEQHYYSATEVKNNFDATEGAKGDILQRYCYENTFGKGGQLSPRINGTMILLYAQAKKHGAAAYEDLYAYMGQTYTYAEYAEHLIATIYSNIPFCINDGGTYKQINTVPDFWDKSKNYLKVVKACMAPDFYSDNVASYHDQEDDKSQRPGLTDKFLRDLYPGWVVDLSGSVQAADYEPAFKSVPTTFAADKLEKGYADGYVTLVPDTAMPQLYLYNPAHASDPTQPEYLPATDADIAQAFLGSVVECANMYEKGKMYYAIPIEHFGRAKTEVTATNPVAEPLEGNYGVVRNNLYKVSIGEIKSLGHGISDVDEPIVPGDRKKPYYLGAQINILSWQVATQTADLQE